MALLKKFAGETVIYGLGSVLPRVLLFSLTPYLTRIFDPSEFGIHAATGIRPWRITDFSIISYSCPLLPWSINIALGGHEWALLPTFSPAHHPAPARQAPWRSFCHRREPAPETATDYPQPISSKNAESGYRQVNYTRLGKSDAWSQATALLHSLNAPTLRSR